MYNAFTVVKISDEQVTNLRTTQLSASAKDMSDVFGTNAKCK